MVPPPPLACQAVELSSSESTNGTPSWLETSSRCSFHEFYPSPPPSPEALKDKLLCTSGLRRSLLLQETARVHPSFWCSLFTAEVLHRAPSQGPGCHVVSLTHPAPTGGHLNPPPLPAPLRPPLFQRLPAAAPHCKEEETVSNKVETGVPLSPPHKAHWRVWERSLVLFPGGHLTKWSLEGRQMPLQRGGGGPTACPAGSSQFHFYPIPIPPPLSLPFPVAHVVGALPEPRALVEFPLRPEFNVFTGIRKEIFTQCWCEGVVTPGSDRRSGCGRRRSGRQISPRVEGGMAAAENKNEREEHSNKLHKEMEPGPGITSVKACIRSHERSREGSGEMCLQSPTFREEHRLHVHLAE
ncbi:unnamed protein product [Pleuronectes platessa]|uniref:Uncharacterized protein n=1 Tax=Pleuronectes platessa TaxID=8262 RepID=A0A9N7U1N9_PLEPL|nr:unnamed protein product [Pleuronectes platessa]